MYQMEYLVQTSGAAKGKDPLEQQEGQLVSGMPRTRRTSGLRKRGRDAIGLVGETKRETTLTKSTTSTNTGRRRSRTTILVGEIGKVLSGERLALDAVTVSQPTTRKSSAHQDRPSKEDRKPLLDVQLAGAHENRP